MADTPKIYVDFQNCDTRGRVRLNTEGTFNDLKELGVTLEAHLPLIVYSEEFEAVGRVQFSIEENIWVVQIDWRDIREI